MKFQMNLKFNQIFFPRCQSDHNKNFAHTNAAVLSIDIYINGLTQDCSSASVFHKVINRYDANFNFNSLIGVTGG